MQRLLERYIEPLRDDSKLLPADVIESLFVSVNSIHRLQLTFLQRLESNIPTEILAYNTIDEFHVGHQTLLRTCHRERDTNNISRIFLLRLPRHFFRIVNILNCIQHFVPCI
jgi:hypothetical protein